MDIERLIKTIAADETFSPTAYWDVDHYSIGFGTPAIGPSSVISFKEAWSIMEARVVQAIREYEDIFREELPLINDVRAECLVNMLYNLGKTRFLGFHRMLRYIRRFDWMQAAYEAQDSKWFKQTGNRAKRIVRQLATGKREE